MYVHVNELINFTYEEKIQPTKTQDSFLNHIKLASYYLIPANSLSF